jgi:hypothetical protein
VDGDVAQAELMGMVMSVLPASQNKRRALYRNLTFGLVGLLIVAAVAKRLLGIEVHQFAVVVTIAVFALAVLQFNELDEVAKQAHYVAWYWGSMLAVIVISALALATFAFPDMSAAWIAEHVLPFWGDGSVDTVFMAGLMTGPMVMLAGFALWWSVYWLRRR